MEVNQAYVCVYIYIYIYIYISTPCKTSLPPLPSYFSRSLQSTKMFPVLYIMLPLAVCFTCGSIYVCVCVSILISQFVPPSLTPTTVSTCPFSMSVSLFLPCKWNHLYHFSILHIYWLIYNILNYITLWQILGLPTSISFLFMAEYCNIPLYTCTTLLYPFRC